MSGKPTVNPAPLHKWRRTLLDRDGVSLFMTIRKHAGVVEETVMGGGSYESAVGD